MVMFSATWPAAVHWLAQEYMDPNPVKVLDDRACYERLTAFKISLHWLNRMGSI
ncbi:hypothetical protein ES332_D02G155200v1 [Gossypium tomentosum]|uniref:Uncharacterized protein n=1 Tax=Gossypium tomentosum TaxID=34277 RepID=A0A5D2LXJ3_GOSTO|nr:hypothetical protein ES332_D02G155200v1 [Gossypium tomentosum]